MHNKNKTVVISGCGFRQIADTFCIGENLFKSKNVKINIGAATAFALAESGWELIILSKTQEKLDAIRNSILEFFPDTIINAKALDLLSEVSVREFVNSLDRNKRYSYVHCAGISSGSYKLINDNPYLSVEETPIDLPTIEFEAVVKSLLIITQALLPLFKTQDESRIIVVSSMSSVRSVPFGYSHSSAKAGLHHASRSLALELNQSNIFVSEVMPGAVDTGMYDNEIVEKRVIEMAKYFGYNYTEIPMMPPSSVADAVKICLESKSHILSINMVAQGQWPNLSS